MSYHYFQHGEVAQYNHDFDFPLCLALVIVIREHGKTNAKTFFILFSFLWTILLPLKYHMSIVTFHISEING